MVPLQTDESCCAPDRCSCRLATLEHATHALSARVQAAHHIEDHSALQEVRIFVAERLFGPGNIPGGPDRKGQIDDRDEVRARRLSNYKVRFVSYRYVGTALSYTLL